MSVVFYSEGKAIKPATSKLVAKYVFLQAPSKLDNRLAGFGADSRTGGLEFHIPILKNDFLKTI